MDKLLQNIDTAKRDRILNSAFEEFAANGYDKASTNEIVKKAGISKGLLFHYFGSKEQLYREISSFAQEYIMDVIEKGINWDEKDIFKRCREIVELKISVTKDYPHIYDFLRSTLDASDIAPFSESCPAGALEAVDKIYTYNIDFSLFRDDIKPEQAIDMIKWVLSGVTEREWAHAKGNVEISEVIEVHCEYLAVLKHLLYK